MKCDQKYFKKQISRQKPTNFSLKELSTDWHNGKTNVKQKINPQKYLRQTKKKKAEKIILARTRSLSSFLVYVQAT